MYSICFALICFDLSRGGEPRGLRANRFDRFGDRFGSHLGELAGHTRVIKRVADFDHDAADQFRVNLDDDSHIGLEFGAQTRLQESEIFGRNRRGDSHDDFQTISQLSSCLTAARAISPT